MSVAISYHRVPHCTVPGGPLATEGSVLEVTSDLHVGHWDLEIMAFPRNSKFIGRELPGL